MPKRFKIIEGAFKDIATNRDEDQRLGAMHDAREKAQKDRMANKKASGSIPKNNPSVFSSKPEPNRGPGADRHPNVPHAKITRPTMGEETVDEAQRSEFTANMHLSGSLPGRKAPGHYLMRQGRTLHDKPHPTAQAALNAYHKLPNKEGVKIHHMKEEFADAMSNTPSPALKSGKKLKDFRKKAIKEEGGVAAGVSVGSGAVAGITDPTTNYSLQIDKKRKQLKSVKSGMVRRKRPIGEAYAPGVSYEKTIYLMRHGKTALDSLKRSDGWLDFPLTDEGRLGLVKAQQYLKNVPLTCIYAASLKRTKETGEIIASGTLSNPPIEIADQLKTWNLGNMMGTQKKPNKPIVMHYMKNPDDKPVGGESMSEFRARFLPWIENLKEEVKAGSGPVLVIVSGTNLREISQALYNDTNVLNMDEGGLLCLQPSGDSWHAQVIFGHHDGDEDYVS